VRHAAAALLALLVLAACGGSNGALTIQESAERYADGEETMTIKGALVIEYGKPQLCSGVTVDDDPGTPVCASPAYWLEFGAGLPDVTLSSRGTAHWAEDVSFHGTLDEGIFTVDR
jgi:hypothetical protein